MTDILAIISDMHLGKGNGAEDFGPEYGPHAMRFRDQLWQWRADDVIVVLNGDGPDLWQAEENEIIEAHPLTIEALRRTVKHYVRGNHDRKATSNFLGLEPLPYLVLGDTFIEHGDAHDWWVANHPMFCQRVSSVAGWLERIVHKDSDEWATRFWYWLSGTGRHGRGQTIARYHEAVGKEARAHGCERAFYGHLHEWYHYQVMPPKGFSKWTDPEVGNTGCCCGGRFDVTRLEV